MTLLATQPSRRTSLPSRIRQFVTEPRTLAEAAAVLYMVGIAAAANGLHLFYIMFPELGALAIDVLTRPHGKWAKEPWKLVVTPTATAVVGIAVRRHVAYGVTGILVIMSLSIGIILALRSAVAPAISAGVLPLVLDVKSWFYPPSICLVLIVLVQALLIWRRLAPARRLRFLHRADFRTIELLESRPRSHAWYIILFLFTAAAGALAVKTGLRFILFPPLIVLAYEMLGHPETCAWSDSPYHFPLASIFAAITGVMANRWIRPEPLAVLITLAITVALLRVFRLHMPPALSIGLLPFVMNSPTLMYAVSVGIGTFALTITFLLYRRFASSFSGSRLERVETT
jgi:CBS-domain-containing membrane protein